MRNRSSSRGNSSRRICNPGGSRVLDSKTVTASGKTDGNRNTIQEWAAAADYNGDSLLGMEESEGTNILWQVGYHFRSF